MKTLVPLSLILICFLVCCSPKPRNGEHVVQWTGMNLNTCTIAFDGEKLGSGYAAFSLLLERMSKLPLQSHIEYDAPEAAIIRTAKVYSRSDSLPFMDDDKSRDLFEKISADRELSSHLKIR